MPKQPIAMELEAVNREGKTQVVRDRGAHTGLQRIPAGCGGQWTGAGYLGGRLQHYRACQPTG